MRRFSMLVAPLALLVAAGAAGCFITGDDGDDDDGEGGSKPTSATNGSGAGTEKGTGSGTKDATAGTMSTTGGGPGTPGWTAVPLIDDTTDPERTIFRTGNDLISGIYFSSLDDGLVTTIGDEQTFGNGGAVFKATQKQVTNVLFGGNRNGLCLLGTINFLGIEKLDDRIVALTHACDIVSSKDGGASFDIEANGVDQFGIQQVLAMRSRADGTFAALNSRYFAKTSGAPGPNSIWDDVYAPEAVPTTPNPLPADQCQQGPTGSVPIQRGRVHVSQDGQFVAYSATQDDEAVVCVSHDGGVSFFPKKMTGVGEDAAGFPPSGVAFTSPTVGIAFWGNNIYPGQQYILRTTDAGETWTAVAVPADVAQKSIEFQNAFFAPDGQSGWIVGYNYENSIALMLKTTDGGLTWSSASGDLAAKVNAAGGGKLFTGFALDANHLWVGGERGVLMANEAGGE